MPDATTPDAPRAAHRPAMLGGSFAPPLDAAKAAEYRTLAEGAKDRQVRDMMTTLLDMADAYHAAPEPAAATKKGAKAAATKDAGTPHPSGLGTMYALPADEVERLWDAVPWQEEVEMFCKVFERIDPVADKAIRTAAFHLAWLAMELTLDRKPITSDQL